MSYGSGKFPMECASKLGHMKVIEHEHVNRLLRQFERIEPSNDPPVGAKTGNFDLSAPSPIRFVITVDGGQAIVPNEIRREKRMAFINFCAMIIRRDDIAQLRKNPIVDPRQLSKMFDQNVWYQAVALPLAGIHLPGETVKETIRKTVDAVLEYTKLYGVLADLVFHKWDPGYEMDPQINQDAPHMDCLDCGRTIYLSKDNFNFSCPACKSPHRLSDYLGITQNLPDEWAREEAAMNLRNALETLTLFHFVLRYWERKPELLSQVLFLKDGPLLLRAQLSRLVEPIRNFINTLKNKQVKLHMVGVEKNGELADHIEEIRKHLPEKGDFFLPSIKYIMEEIAGMSFDERRYRNRVQYGAKLVVRLGPDHVIPLNLPTGDFLKDPSPESLIGASESLTVLSELTSYSHDNALIPIKLANSYSSISRSPSGDILKAFANHLFLKE